jgi:hypothetical protein
MVVEGYFGTGRAFEVERYSFCRCPDPTPFGLSTGQTASLWNHHERMSLVVFEIKERQSRQSGGSVADLDYMLVTTGGNVLVCDQMRFRIYSSRPITNTKECIDVNKLHCNAYERGCLAPPIVVATSYPCIGIKYLHFAETKIMVRDS